jgi:hypothetical protein
MIQIIDTIDCDALHRSIVKPDAMKKAVLVQDAAMSEQLFALLMVDALRAVLVAQGSMSLQATAGLGMYKLQSFRNQLYKTGVTAQELKFCVPQSFDKLGAEGASFDPAWFVEPSFPELLPRFQAWRAGKATW